MYSWKIQWLKWKTKITTGVKHQISAGRISEFEARLFEIMQFTIEQKKEEKKVTAYEACGTPSNIPT